MPPAVAQAPIVISTASCSRTSGSASTSWAVVIEPSTKDTSYGPGSTALDASRKWRSAPGRRSEQLVLAVEQGELAAVARRELPYRQGGRAHQSSRGRVAARRARSRRPARPGRPGADRAGSVHTARCRIHVALQRDPDVFGAPVPLPARGRRAEPHHRFGPAQERGRLCRVERQAGSGSVTNPTCTVPSGGGLVDGQVDLEIAARAPRRRAGRGTGTRRGFGRRRSRTTRP